ncbi:MAG: type II toxin-antitoxin system RelE/ParE family toxin [Chloroflexi bacterium]|nr:type II toxin-antitoxin system RelE/ParE family toxin [Chloroflexota bacterium]
MEVRYAASFTRDLRRVRDAALRNRVERLISDIKAAPTITAIGGAARLRGSGRYYRFRIGDYRLGLALEDDAAVLIRFLHRRDIYRFFP